MKSMTWWKRCVSLVLLLGFVFLYNPGDPSNKQCEKCYRDSDGKLVCVPVPCS